MERDENKVCFIISHKWIRNINSPYESYLSYYIQNINSNYKNAKIIVVDNSSLYKEDIFEPLRHIENVVFLDNDTESRFEVGAYTVGLKYLLENKLENEYSYIVMTQDNMVLKNKFDFINFKINNITSATIYSHPYDFYAQDIVSNILNKFNINDRYGEFGLCWCCCFVINSCKIYDLYHIFSQIKINDIRHESCAAERWLGRVVLELNDTKQFIHMDGSSLNMYYNNTKPINVYDKTNKYFIKKLQQKTENTKDVT